MSFSLIWLFRLGCYERSKQWPGGLFLDVVVVVGHILQDLLAWPSLPWSAWSMTCTADAKYIKKGREEKE